MNEPLLPPTNKYVRVGYDILAGMMVVTAIILIGFYVARGDFSAPNSGEHKKHTQKE